MRLSSCLLGVLLLASTTFAALPDAFSGEGLNVRFTNKDPDNLRGNLELGGQTYPFTAARSGDAQMAGTFTAAGQAYKFTLSATPEGGAVLETDGVKYRLTAAGAPAPKPGPGPQPVDPQPVQPAAGANPNITYVPAQVIDPKTRLVVATLLAPKGWQIDPGVLWRPMDAQFVSLQTTIWDEKTGWVVRWIPHDQFSCSPELFDNGRRQGAEHPRSIGGVEYTREVPNAVQYIQNIVLPRYRQIPNLKVVGGEDLPKLAEAIDRSQAFQRQAYTIGGRELRYSAGRVRLEYPARNGVMMEEDIICVVNISWSVQGMANARAIGVNGEIFFMPDRIYSYAAPKGQLNTAAPFLECVVLSMRADETWIKFVDNIQGAVTAIVNDQFKMEEAARRAITASQRKSVEESWKSADQQSREVGALLSGTQARSNPFNPNAPPTNAPAGKKSWTNPRGEWKHLEPNEDPNRDPGSTGDWREAGNATN